MKLSVKERNDLRRRIIAARAASTLRNIEIARATGVDAGQASKIARGEFSTLSDSVVKICNVLGVDLLSGKDASPDAAAAAGADARRAAAWNRLETSVRRAWDETPDGADRLIRIVDAFREATRP